MLGNGGGVFTAAGQHGLGDWRLDGEVVDLMSQDVLYLQWRNTSDSIPNDSIMVTSVVISEIFTMIISHLKEKTGLAKSLVLSIHCTLLNFKLTCIPQFPYSHSYKTILKQ